MVQTVKDLIGASDLNLSNTAGRMYVDLSTKIIISQSFNSLFSAVKRGQVTENIITGSGHDYVLGSNNNNLIDLGAGCDIAFGRGGNDFIDAGNGNDYVDGGNGNDRLRGENGHDKLFGGNGNDSMDGGSDNDLLYGNHGNDVIFGGSGDDCMFGGQGNDRLAGSSGADFMVGGQGNDLFFYSNFGNSTAAAKDCIADFEKGADKIFFSNFSPDLACFTDLVITNLTADGSKVNVNHTSADFSFDLAFACDSDYGLTASDFTFAAQNCHDLTSLEAVVIPVDPAIV